MTSRLLRDVEPAGVDVVEAWQALAEAQDTLARTAADADVILDTLAALALALASATTVIVVLDDGRVASAAQACPGEPVPTSSTPAPETSAPVPAGVPAATPAPAQPYANCAAVRAAGAAPLHRGDPGWSDRMDGDGDGVACE